MRKVFEGIGDIVGAIVAMTFGLVWIIVIAAFFIIALPFILVWLLIDSIIMGIKERRGRRKKW